MLQSIYNPRERAFDYLGLNYTLIRHNLLPVSLFNSSSRKSPSYHGMETTWVYAIVVAGVACSLVLLNAMPYLSSAIKTTKRLTYLNILDRHSLVGPWRATTLLSLTLYLAVNAFCLSFKVDNLSHTGRRAGALSLINLSPLLGSFHLDFLASILGLSLKTTRSIHRSAGCASFALAVFHVAVAAATENAAFQTESSRVPTIMVSLSRPDSVLI